MEIITAAVVAIGAIIGGLFYKLRNTGPDVNGDGKINLEDAKAAVSKLKTEASVAATALKSEVSNAKTALKSEAPNKIAKVTEKAKSVADVNKDGKVDLKDALAVATKVKGSYRKKK